MFSISTSTYDEDKYTIDSQGSKFNSNVNVNGKKNDDINFILPKIPNYTNHHIDEMIRYNDNKYNNNYGLTYLYNNQYKMKERNEYLYKIRSELNSDELTFISHSKISKKHQHNKYQQKHYHHKNNNDNMDNGSIISVTTTTTTTTTTTSSAAAAADTTNIGDNSNSNRNSSGSNGSHYYKGYPDYVETKANFPILYNEIHENIKDSLINNNNINSSNSSSIYRSHHSYTNHSSSNDSNHNMNNIITTSKNNKKKKIKKNNRYFQFNDDDDNSSKSSDFTFSKYINDDDEYDNGLSYYDKGEGSIENIISNSNDYDNIDDDDDDNSKHSDENNNYNKLNTVYVYTTNKNIHKTTINTNNENNTMKINDDIKNNDNNDDDDDDDDNDNDNNDNNNNNSSNSIVISSNSNNSINKFRNNDINITDDNESIKINNNFEYQIITEPTIQPPKSYQFTLKLHPFEKTSKKLHNYGYNLIKCNHALHRRDIKIRQERYEREYHDIQLKLLEEEEDRNKRVQYLKHKTL